METINYKGLLEEYAYEHSLKVVQTTTDPSGKPKNTSYALIGFWDFDDILWHLRNISGCENSNIFKLVSIKRSSTTTPWAIEGEITAPYDMQENVYGDRDRYEIKQKITDEEYGELMKEFIDEAIKHKDTDAKTLYNKHKDRINYAGDLHDLDESQIFIIDKTDNTYFITDKFDISYIKDGVGRQIAIIAENRPTSCYDD